MPVTPLVGHAGREHFNHELRRATQMALIIQRHDIGNDDAAPPQTVRSLADAQLPWTLQTSSADPGADFARLTARHHLLLAGLGLAGRVREGPR